MRFAPVWCLRTPEDHSARRLPRPPRTRWPRRFPAAHPGFSRDAAPHLIRNTRRVAGRPVLTPSAVLKRPCVGTGLQTAFDARPAKCMPLRPGRQGVARRGQGVARKRGALASDLRAGCGGHRPLFGQCSPACRAVWGRLRGLLSCGMTENSFCRGGPAPERPPRSWCRPPQRTSPRLQASHGWNMRMGCGMSSIPAGLHGL